MLRRLVLAATFVLAGCGPHLPPGPNYPADRTDYWAAIGRCEQPGNGWAGVRWDHPGPAYQGGLGFAASTWAAFRLEGMPANAGSATPEEQMVVADVLYDRYGGSPWGCWRTLGYPTRP